MNEDASTSELLASPLPPPRRAQIFFYLSAAPSGSSSYHLAGAHLASCHFTLSLMSVVWRLWTFRLQLQYAVVICLCVSYSVLFFFFPILGILFSAVDLQWNVPSMSTHLGQYRLSNMNSSQIKSDLATTS